MAHTRALGLILPRLGPQTNVCPQAAIATFLQGTPEEQQQRIRVDVVSVTRFYWGSNDWHLF